jgi:glycine betaine/proline transport system substrate-binding protein
VNKYLAIFTLIMLGCLNASFAADDVIVLPLNAWGSQRVLTKAVAKKINMLGYQVEFINISSTDQWGALRKGIIHLQVEVWKSNEISPFMEAVSNKHIVDVGEHSVSVFWFVRVSQLKTQRANRLVGGVEE